MKVYVIIGGYDYEDSDVLEVRTSQTVADARVEEIERDGWLATQRDGSTYQRHYGYVTVEEHEVKE